MDASISEPFHLASYNTPQRLQRSKSHRPTSNVYATHENIASGSRDGYVTATAQGDGIHVLDLSTLHPVVSHTLGPSTSFCCPSVTLSSLEEQENICTTYAAIASSADIPSEDGGRTIWTWRENVSSSVGDRVSQKRKATVLPHQISNIHPCNEMPQRLLVSSPEGDLTLLEADLGIRSTLPAPSTSASVLHSFVLSRESNTFLSGAPGRTAVLRLERSKDGTMDLRILDVSSDGELSDLGSTQIPVDQEQITAVSCSSSGYLSVLTSDGSWNSFQIELKNGVEIYPVAQPLHLKSLTFIGKPIEPTMNGEVSIIALNTSIVLLAAISSSPTRNIVLLVWDLQYSVLLASHVHSIPSTLSHLSKISLSLSLVTISTPQALLILSPPSAESPKTTASTRSSILVVPLTVPKMSTIANAIGRAAAGASWLVQPSADDTLGPSRAKALAAIQTAMMNNELAAAEKAFADWEQSEQQSRESESKLVYGHSFVRDVLNAVLQPTKQSSPYSPGLLRTLLQRRVVSTTMVEGGLLAALKLRGDWTSIDLCTSHVTDLTETELIFTLQSIAEHNRKSHGADAMQVDASPLGTIPTLSAFLNACVRYPTSPPNLRTAVHQYLSQPEDLVAVLEILDNWLGRWKGAEVIALPPTKSTGKNEDGIVVLKEGWQKEEHSAAHPPLIKVLSFIQTILDASFLALLQHTPAHRVLQRVLAKIQPEIQLTEQVEILRGPLEMFARAQAKAVRDGKDGKKDQGDWRRRRRLEHERAAMAVGGVYQLEELVL
ncbi:hypothetical protein R3P38DRAFT_2908933 [Favolaschia claudopus]|uniref:Uncharacterized protein n=1 Tax=Favolaschia claudopus TaxID=2862362 RepID=A0AAW0CAJ3_9AGAR